MTSSPEKRAPENRKQKKERLQRERDAVQQAERDHVTDGEAAGRANLSQTEELERTKYYLEFRDVQVSKLMIDRFFYNQLLQKVADLTESHAESQRQLQAELELTIKTKTTLETEMADIRLDQRLQAKALPRKIKELEDSMRQNVQNVIASVEDQKKLENETVMQSFNFQFGKNKQRYLDLLYETEEKLKHFSQVLAESKTMHSNLPTRIKRLLEDRTKEEILFMIDTLSYEEGVLQYFEKKFPKDCPHRWPTAVTPNTKLLNAEDEEKVEVDRRMSEKGHV
eukprot:NODE_333_length_1463_cov_202.850778_g244_i0.p1 GENE.NODE_333_length_1463_cov_202.850778_g244_i0~~NODE_333_length_1463_cov_202.850778_g244_i0.p1  ORF type:complete len:282 (+),score=95.78 NODE_333_length_1463_cov_202.850778_g244_i0:144-989(+)